ncbi:RNA polymerase sigma-70 factor, ECF subfamily [Lampropedia hyalina DSM 16112]|jgi:RNA polymerase sigma-70 factor (ECF subfamily)|uniref:RNA polymerase sigma-70 factor, ECF subfamily n=1 Tax=Lampropedia hyalina DSM 16112 TaxID=1122156 RepID=A0A1M5BU18_9BURK|nr:RNA polymerase sigma factor [Lampropedia hyalina]SHF45998.1 RNA polymerase sigma-70 factor, ECF subfamily [Lampropedia hyalina DSM 16112]
MLISYYRETLKFCRRLVRDDATAEDVVQEAYACTLAMEQSGQSVRHPRALLRKIAQRIVIDMGRKSAHRQHESIEALEEDRQPAIPVCMQPDELYASRQALQAYQHAIDGLPPRCREAFSLYVFDGMSAQEIAGQMGISLSMANQYVRRGKLACLSCQEALDGVSANPPGVRANGADTDVA